MRKSLAVAKKELRQIARDRRTLLILLFIPIFFLLLYGYALNFDIRNLALGLEDNDRSVESRRLVSAFVNSGYFRLEAAVDRDRTIERLMDANRIHAALLIPEGFARRIERGQPASVQLIVNGDNANTATILIGYATAIVRGFSTAVRVERRDTIVPPAVSAEPRVWFNPELRSTLFLVPGLIAYIAMITAVASTALSVVREKERGTIEQVRMAPIGALPFVAGKAIPYLVLSLVSEVGIVLLSMALFDLPLRGSWLDLLLTLSLFLAGALATGLLISTVADSQQLAFQLVLVVAFLPTLMLSDFIFPISSMPAALQAVTRIVPARYFLVALRGILLKGVDLSVIWPELAALSVYAVVMLGLTTARLTRQWS